MTEPGVVSVDEGRPNSDASTRRRICIWGGGGLSLTQVLDTLTQLQIPFSRVQRVRQRNGTRRYDCFVEAGEVQNSVRRPVSNNDCLNVANGSSTHILVVWKPNVVGDCPPRARVSLDVEFLDGRTKWSVLLAWLLFGQTL